MTAHTSVGLKEEEDAIQKESKKKEKRRKY